MSLPFDLSLFSHISKSFDADNVQEMCTNEIVFPSIRRHVSNCMWLTFRPSIPPFDSVAISELRFVHLKLAEHLGCLQLELSNHAPSRNQCHSRTLLYLLTTKFLATIAPGRSMVASKSKHSSSESETQSG